MYLIIGASGFIGRHLYNYYRQNGIDVLGTCYRNSYDSEWIPFDICTDDLYELCQIRLHGETPEAVIICGANASIDGCKRDENASNCLNVTGTKKILDQIDRMGTKSVFLSSEAVFDGKKGMYSEEDIVNPITLYGKQKLKIEKYMQSNMRNYLIFRISRAVGSKFGEKDIFNDFYNKIIWQEDIVCLRNQSFCITEIGDIVCGIVEALKADIRGLYHLSSMNYISRYELASLYAEKMFGGYERIKEKEYRELPFIDRRHVYGGLNGNALKNLLGIKYKGIPEILNRYTSSYLKFKRKETDHM